MTLANQKILVARHYDRGWDGKAEDDGGIGADVAPDLPLIGYADSVHSTAEAEMIGDDLEMQVRCPLPVFRCCAERGEGFALGNRLSNREPGNTFACQVPVKCPENGAIVCVMLQKNCRAEAECDGVVVDECDSSGKGRVHRLAGRHEYINTKMHRPARSLGSRFESVALIDCPVLAIEAGARFDDMVVSHRETLDPDEG